MNIEIWLAFIGGVFSGMACFIAGYWLGSMSGYRRAGSEAAKRMSADFVEAFAREVAAQTDGGKL